ncbi:MAG: PspA/IM30 family protein [Salibacteraceae bacterium]
MNILKRLFKIGQAEANSAIDKLEDPIKLTEQGIRDMKKQLDESLKALAEVKALEIRSRNDVETNRNQAEDYEKKAMLLLQQAEKGDLSPQEADRLATEALLKKEQAVKAAATAAEQQAHFAKNVSNLDTTVKRLRSEIGRYESELKTLKARVKVSAATKNLNKQLAQIDSTDTISMLERMKEKVAQDEALAESYGEIANESRTIDQEIDKALENADQHQASDQLAALKAKMGLNKADDSKNPESEGGA